MNKNSGWFHFKDDNKLFTLFEKSKNSAIKCYKYEVSKCLKWELRLKKLKEYNINDIKLWTQF